LVSNAIDGKEAKMVYYRLPSVGTRLKLDRRCPHCRRPNGTIHSGVRRRAIRDHKVTHVLQRRMKCPWCRLTWTIRSEGIKSGHQRSEALVVLGVVLYMFGLSYRKAATFLAALGCPSSKSSIERDVAAAGGRAGQLHGWARRKRVRVLGVDGTGAAMAGCNDGVLFFVDVDGRRLLWVVLAKETQAGKVRRYVREVMAQVGAEELRTDEHSVYEGIVPEGCHRLCLTHWRKSKGKRAWDLMRQAKAEERPLEVDSMRQLLALLRLQPRPPTVPEELSRLVRRYIRCRKGLLWKINQLLQHIERTWEKVSDDPMDATNNATEQVIGQTLKIRAKTMRGFKSPRKVLTHAYLASFLRGRDGVCDLREVI
jgi:transposase-like protein